MLQTPWAHLGAHVDTFNSNLATPPKEHHACDTAHWAPDADNTFAQAASFAVHFRRNLLAARASDVGGRLHARARSFKRTRKSACL